MSRSRHVALALSAALAAASVQGCRASGQCREEAFRLRNRDFTGEALAYAQGRGTDDLVCQSLCEQAMSSATITELDRCVYTLADVDSARVDTGGPDDEAAGSVTCSGERIPLCKGRRPLGLVEAPPTPTDLVSTLARFAREERGAVVGFEQLATALRAWNAPRSLVERCKEAADQERAHDRLLTAEVHARGGVVAPLVLGPADCDLEALAILNAVEGCANEAAAALVAHLLASSAPTRSLRATFARIAVEETGHAQLSWDLHRWFVDRLDKDGARRVSATLARALDSLPAVLEAECALLPDELSIGVSLVAVGEVLRERLTA